MAPLIVQQAKNSGTSATFTNPVTIGNTIIVGMGVGSDNSPFVFSGLTVTDGGNTYTIGSSNYGYFTSAGTNYFVNGTVAFCPVTSAQTTVSTSGASSGALQAVQIYEVSGLGAYDATTTMQSLGSDNTATLTTGFNHEFVYVFTGTIDSGATTPSGFTLLQSSTTLSPPFAGGVTDYWKADIGASGSHTIDIGSCFGFQIALAFQRTAPATVNIAGFIM